MKSGATLREAPQIWAVAQVAWQRLTWAVLRPDCQGLLVLLCSKAMKVLCALPAGRATEVAASAASSALLATLAVRRLAPGSWLAALQLLLPLRLTTGGAAAQTLCSRCNVTKCVLLCQHLIRQADMIWQEPGGNSRSTAEEERA